MIWPVICGAIFLLLGIFLFLKPGLVFKLTEQWKSYSAEEPSDLYLISTKFGGVLLFLLGISMIVLPFILE